MSPFTPGTRLHYQIDGAADAPPLLLINALGTTIDLWADHAPRLAATYRVIRYDARGHGQSGGVPRLRSGQAPRLRSGRAGGSSRSIKSARMRWTCSTRRAWSRRTWRGSQSAG